MLANLRLRGGEMLPAPPVTHPNLSPPTFGCSALPSGLCSASRSVAWPRLASLKIAVRLTLVPESQLRQRDGAHAQSRRRVALEMRSCLFITIDNGDADVSIEQDFQSALRFSAGRVFQRFIGSFCGRSRSPKPPHSSLSWTGELR